MQNICFGPLCPPQKRNMQPLLPPTTCQHFFSEPVEMEKPQDVFVFNLLYGVIQKIYVHFNIS